MLYGSSAYKCPWCNKAQYPSPQKAVFYHNKQQQRKPESERTVGYPYLCRNCYCFHIQTQERPTDLPIELTYCPEAKKRLVRKISEDTFYLTINTMWEVHKVVENSRAFFIMRDRQNSEHALLWYEAV